MSTNATTAAAPPPLSALKDLDFSQLTQNYAGFRFNEYILRLTPGMTINSLIERPDLWRRIQATRTPVQKLDRIIVVDASEETLAESYVSEATHSTVVLAKPRIVTLTARSTANLLRTNTHHIDWIGELGSYAVFRSADGQRVSQPTRDLAIAERDLRNIGPQRV